ncbi:MAG: hypothetical protein WCG31_00210 [Deltaproteobacteria bacterium]
MYNLGLSARVLPFDNIKHEDGVDFLKKNSDDHPFYFNAKLATPEDAFGIKGLPAFAVGGYNLGTVDANQQNIVYALIASVCVLTKKTKLWAWIRRNIRNQDRTCSQTFCSCHTTGSRPILGGFFLIRSIYEGFGGQT